MYRVSSPRPGSSSPSLLQTLVREGRRAGSTTTLHSRVTGCPASLSTMTSSSWSRAVWAATTSSAVLVSVPAELEAWHLYLPASSLVTAGQSREPSGPGLTSSCSRPDSLSQEMVGVGRPEARQGRDTLEPTWTNKNHKKT